MTSVTIEEAKVQRGRTGDNVKLQLRGIDEEDLSAGHVSAVPTEYSPEYRDVSTGGGLGHRR